MRRSRCFVFDLPLEFARFLLRQNQSVQLRHLCICVLQPCFHLESDMYELCKSTKLYIKNQNNYMKIVIF